MDWISLRERLVCVWQGFLRFLSWVWSGLVWVFALVWPCVVSFFGSLPRSTLPYHRGLLAFEPNHVHQADVVQHNVEYLRTHTFPRGQTRAAALTASGNLFEPRLAVQANCMLSWSDQHELIIMEPYDCYNQPITYEMAAAAVRTENEQYLQTNPRAQMADTIRYWHRRIFRMTDRNVAPADPTIVFLLSRAVQTIVREPMYGMLEIYLYSSLEDPETRFSYAPGDIESDASLMAPLVSSTFVEESDV